MKTIPGTAIVLGGVALVAILLATVGAPSERQAPAPVSTSTAKPASVSARGFVLTSASAELPDDAGQYPAGPPHADTINANCTACHSASMALSQPPLSADQWTTEVIKMREVYHAPVAVTDMPAIIDYLVHMPSQKGFPAPGKAQNLGPKAVPDVSGGSG